MPFRLGFWTPIFAGPGQLEPGVRVGIDWLSITQTSPGKSQTQNSKYVEAALCYRIAVLRRLFARIGGAVGAGKGYIWSQPDQPGAPLFTEPTSYIKAGLELGFSFQ